MPERAPLQEAVIRSCLIIGAYYKSSLRVLVPNPVAPALGSGVLKSDHALISQLHS